MHTKTIKQLSQDLHSKKMSSMELTTYYFKRIQAHDEQLNSFITIDEDFALMQAKKADEMLAKGEGGALTGIPIAHKDLFCTLGMKTTCASRMLENFIAPYNATMIEKFNQAGAVILGKTNMDEFAMGSSNENSFFGNCANPWALEYAPGGSSGGSVACVAARIAPGSTGTDTGGSIRQPAAHTGLTGLKPTYGRVSRYGMIAFASSLDQAGPITQTAEDAALMLNVMAGHDEKDSTSADHPVPDYTANLNDSVKGLRIGLPKEYFDQHLEEDIAEKVEEVKKALEAQGAICTEVSLPHTEHGLPVYYIVAPAECSSNLSRFDGVRYGYRCQNPKDLQDLYKRSRGEGFGAEVKRRVMVGTYALSSGFYDAYYTQAQKIRRLIKNDFVNVFQDVDVILCPTTPTKTFKLGEKAKNPMALYAEDIFTCAANLAGLPAVSAPCGFVKGLPVAFQVIGNYFDEARILNVVHQYQQVSDWHQQMPEAFK